MHGLVGVDVHRAELEHLERPPVRSQPLLPEQNRARRAPPHLEREDDEQRRDHDEQGGSDGQVEGALEPAGRARDANGRQPHQGQPLDRVDVGARADGLEQARHDIDLDRLVAERADECERVLVALAGERDDDTLDVERARDLGQVVGLADDRQVAEVAARLLRAPIDEPDEVDAVLRVLEDLARDQLADVAGSDDHGVLLVRLGAARDGAGADPPGDHEGHRRRPERDDRADVECAADDRAGGKQEERRDRDHVEDAGDVVDGRVVRPLLVAVVEAVDLGQRDARHRAEHVPGRLRAEELGDEDARQDAEDVGQEQQPTDEPAAAASDGERATAQLPRAKRVRNCALGRCRRDCHRVAVTRPDPHERRDPRSPPGHAPTLHP